MLLDLANSMLVDTLTRGGRPDLAGHRWAMMLVPYWAAQIEGTLLAIQELVHQWRTVIARTIRETKGRPGLDTPDWWTQAERSVRGEMLITYGRVGVYKDVCSACTTVFADGRTLGGYCPRCGYLVVREYPEWGRLWPTSM